MIYSKIKLKTTFEYQRYIINTAHWHLINKVIKYDKMFHYCYNLNCSADKFHSSYFLFWTCEVLQVCTSTTTYTKNLQQHLSTKVQMHLDCFADFLKWSYLFRPLNLIQKQSSWYESKRLDYFVYLKNCVGRIMNDGIFLVCSRQKFHPDSIFVLLQCINSVHTADSCIK
jgi:hypothetical protein